MAKSLADYRKRCSMRFLIIFFGEGSDCSINSLEFNLDFEDEGSELFYSLCDIVHKLEAMELYQTMFHKTDRGDENTGAVIKRIE